MPLFETISSLFQTSSFGKAAINTNGFSSGNVVINSSLSDSDVRDLIATLPQAVQDGAKDVIVVVRNRCLDPPAAPRVPLPPKHNTFVEDGKKYKVNNETGKVKLKTPATDAVVLTGDGQALVQPVYMNETSGSWYIYHTDGSKIEVTPKN